MAEALRRGYATSSTDTGHVGGSASFGMGHPEKVTDFAYRSEHEMTVTAKAIVNAYYGNAPKFSYWTGCSAGGRQAMKAAQMFPGDFDGIIAGSPGLDWSGRTAQAVRIAQALQKEEARITPAKAQVLHSAVVAACDGLDGVKDGLIENPAGLQVRSWRAGLQGWRRASLPDAGAGRNRAADLLAHRRFEDEARRFPVWRPGANWDGPTWAGHSLRVRPVSITSGIWCSPTRSGTFRSSTSRPTSPGYEKA